MIQLADVKLVSAVRPTFQDPVALKRSKFISRVSEQLEIATRVRHQMTQVVDLYRSPYFFTTTTGSFAHF